MGNNKQVWQSLLACVAVYAVMQTLITLDVIGAFWQLNIVLVCINIILAVSLNLINGFTGQFSIGHAGFMAVGAYVGAVLTVKLQLPFMVAILGGA
ncbi:MAG: branched-chain amino acid ABC transporter permease, partial [Sporomusaceae bacterium]|nr:branched-chain amino acid ABC transporter permease [Sporomusaceae bacterium]